VTIVGIALDGVLYKAAFQTTGELNDGLKLGELRSLCGDTCYSDVLSSLYWFIKGTASSLIDDFLGWAASYLPDINQFGFPEFPSNLLAVTLLTIATLTVYLFARKRFDGQ
jgi:hypothetical protein